MVNHEPVGFEIRVFLLLSEVPPKANELTYPGLNRYFDFPKGPTGCSLTSYPRHGQAAGAAPVRQLVRQQLHGHLLVMLIRRYGWTMEMTSLQRSKEKQRKKDREKERKKERQKELINFEI